METKTKLHLLPLLLIFMFIGIIPTSAQRNFFVPHSGATLKFDKKNDLLFSIGGLEKSTFPYFRHLQTQVGYSPIKYLGITAFHSRYSHFQESYRIKNQQQIVYGINIGPYFNSKYYYNRNKYQEYYMGLTAGFSLNKLENYFIEDILNATPEAIVNLDFSKFYIQGEMHYQVFHYFWIGMIYRIGKANYFKGLIEGSDFRGAEDRIVHLLSQPINNFSEFIFKVEIKHKGIGFYIQTTSGSSKQLSENLSVADLGLTINLSEVHSNITKKKKKDLVD